MRFNSLFSADLCNFKCICGFVEGVRFFYLESCAVSVLRRLFLREFKCHRIRTNDNFQQKKPVNIDIKESIEETN